MNIFENLEVWKDSQDLLVDVYLLFQDNKDWGFKDQIQRATLSISNNIAEGAESGTDAMFIRYLKTAKGSCGEVRNMFYACPRIGYCTKEQSVDFVERTKSISRRLAKLIERLENKNGGKDGAEGDKK